MTYCFLKNTSLKYLFIRTTQNLFFKTSFFTCNLLFREIQEIYFFEKLPLIST